MQYANKSGSNVTSLIACFLTALPSFPTPLVPATIIPKQCVNISSRDVAPLRGIRQNTGVSTPPQLWQKLIHVRRLSERDIINTLKTGIFFSPQSFRGGDTDDSNATWYLYSVQRPHQLDQIGSNLIHTSTLACPHLCRTMRCYFS